MWSLLETLFFILYVQAFGQQTRIHTFYCCLKIDFDNSRLDTSETNVSPFLLHIAGVLRSMYTAEGMNGIVPP